MDSVNNMKELREILLSDSVKVVSFDCFDTLLLWPCMPYVLVELQAKSHRIPIPKYKLMRNYHGWWGHIEKENEDIIGTNAQSELFKQKEMEFDLQVLRPRRSVLNLFKELVRKGKEIVITTDMYLSKDFISKLLIANGFTGFSKIYLSANGLSKGNGKLFDKLISDYSAVCNPSEIIHIGDNQQADYNCAIKAGLSAMILKSPIDRFKESRIGQKFVPTCMGDRIMIGQIANYMYDDPFKPTDNWTIADLGYVMGAFLSSMILWMNSDAINKKLEKIFFIMSDGYIPNKIISHFSNVIKTIPVEELYLSRLSRGPRELLDGGITGDVKQLRFYISPKFFKNECSTNAMTIIRKSIAENVVKNSDVIALNHMLDRDKLSEYSNDVETYLDHVIGDTSKFAIFDGSYNGTAYDYLDWYSNHKAVCEYQLVGSPRNAPVYNFIQSKLLSTGKTVLDSDICIKTQARKVDRVVVSSDGIQFIEHGLERPNICSALMMNQELLFSRTLCEIYGDKIEFIAGCGYTFWNPIAYIWESEEEPDKLLVQSVANKTILDSETEYAIQSFIDNESDNLLSDYYISVLYDKIGNVTEAANYAYKSSGNDVLVGQKMFIDIVLKNNLKEYYDYALICIYNLQEYDKAYYGRLGRLYKNGKIVQKDLNRAIELYRIAAAEKIEWTMNELFDCLYEQDPVRNREEMLELVESRMKQGIPSAVSRYGKIIQS